MTRAAAAIPFNRPDLTSEDEAENIRLCIESGHISGDGPFTEKCHALLKELYGSTVLLVHSCTAALEAAAILADLQPGDEVIMPSYTFVSTANAVVLRGAVPVFIDIRPDTLNIDETKIEAAITPRTRAIMPIHYAGVGAEMDRIMAIAARHGLLVIEDAAQGFGATYDGNPLGGIGDMGCLSFHETKNIISGEGGALIVKDPERAKRAFHIREKGTNRTQFLRREITKYEWVDIGSSFLPSDLVAAVLYAQLQRSEAINARRRQIWHRYYEALAPLSEAGYGLPQIPANVVSNGHIFYLLAPTPAMQKPLLDELKAEGIGATSHYVPLHGTPAGRRYARSHGDLATTERVASSIVRLPCFSTLTDAQIDRAVDAVVRHAAALA